MVASRGILSVLDLGLKLGERIVVTGDDDTPDSRTECMEELYILLDSCGQEGNTGGPDGRGNADPDLG
jgi:hypothetical protein